MSKQSKLLVEALSHLGIMAASAQISGKTDYDFYKEYLKFRIKNKKIDKIMNGFAEGSMDFDMAINLLNRK